MVAVPEPESDDEAIPPADADAEAGAETERTDAEPAPEPDLEPAVAEGPRTVGRLIADALRAAGVRYAFTVPGESFLGLLDAFEGAGIRVIATRHEGAAAFMAEAHGQLTGRPAVALGTRAVGGANLAIGIHTARQDSTPMFVAVGQVERALLGREAFQEIDQVATLGGLAKWAAEPHDASRDRRRPWPRRSARRSAAGPGPSCCRCPRTCSTRPMPDDTRVRYRAGRPCAPDRRRDPRGHRAPGLAPSGR